MPSMPGSGTGVPLVLPVEPLVELLVDDEVELLVDDDELVDEVEVLEPVLELPV